jgi:hypothetical protein
VNAPETAQTAADGTASFEVTTMEGGLSTFTLQVDGLEMSEWPTVDVNFAGPSLVGDWSFPQPGGVLEAPRVGLIGIEFETGPNVQELTSVPIEPVPVWEETGSYSIPLPIHAPRDDLYHPDPDDPELPASFRIAPYIIIVYDDLDASGDYTEEEPFVSTFSQQTVMLVYAEGDMPDPAIIPDAAPGYQFMQMTETDIPNIIPWEDLTDEADLVIRSAPCLTAPLKGEVTFGVTLPGDSDTRVGALMVNANLLIGGVWDQIWNGGEYLELASEDVAFAAGSVVEYQLQLPPPGDVDLAYGSLLVDVFPGSPPWGIVYPVVYVDSDGDGFFTNDDDNLATGDLIVGVWDVPFGYNPPMLQWLDGSLGFELSLMLPGVNQGYNLIQDPLRMDIAAVVDDNTLQLTDNIEPGHTNLPFRIIREGAIGEDALVVLEGDDLATGDTPGNLVTSASGGFDAVVLEGDELVITSELEDALILDLDTPYNLITQ